MALSIEEMLKQLLQGGTAGGAGVQLEDPEYQLDLSTLTGRLGEDEAEYVANTTDAQARYERMRREAARQVPKNITNVQEQAAGRGMYYAGGRVEAEGNVHKGHADYVAQTAEAQGSELNSLLRGITSRRNETQRGISLAQQNAAQRALERARNMAPPPGAPTPVAIGNNPQLQRDPIARAVNNNPAATAGAKANMINGKYIDAATGRLAYYGPQGQPAYAKPGPGLKAHRMPDGRIAYYR